MSQSQFPQENPELAAAAAITLEGTPGDEWLIGTSDDDIIHGLAGNDTIFGQGGNDILYGDSGDDSISGDSGDDTLVGGAGDDFLQGSSGNDSYVFGIGSGADTIYDYYGGNRIQLGAGITTSDVTLSRDSNFLFLTLNATGETLMVYSQFDLRGFPIESGASFIEFADGTIWDRSKIFQMTLMGTAGDDILAGSDITNDVIKGFGGNDSLSGLGGNDTLDGGSGDDSLNGGAGDDSYVFGTGSGADTLDDVGGTDRIQLGAGLLAADVTVSRDENDMILTLDTGETLTVHNQFAPGVDFVEALEFADGTIWDQETFFQMVLPATAGDDILEGSIGYDQIFGFGGNDHLYGNEGDDILNGGDGDDTLAGDAGNDTLYGGSGNDSYEFGFGSGADTITDVRGTDRILLGSGISTWDVTVSRSGTDMILTLSSGDTLTVKYQFNTLGYSIEALEFFDGTIWDQAMLANIPTEQDDTLSGGSGNDVINGLGGSDSISGNAGDDFLLGGTGRDKLHGGSGSDELYGDNGNDILWGGSGLDYLYGGHGHNTLLGGAGRDFLFGGSASDVLDGGAGKDYMDGGEGNDIYVYGLGSGNDRVDDAGGAADRILLSDGINTSDVTLTRVEDDLVLTLSTGEKLTIGGRFIGDEEIDFIEFADGTVWDSATMTGMVSGAADANELTLIGAHHGYEATNFA